MKTNTKPSVLRSCTAAAHAAAAHAQEAATWAEVANNAVDSALNTATASNLSASAAKRYATEAAQTVRRLIIAATVATAFSALALTVSVFALYHAA